MKTVAHKNITSWWDGKVIIDEVREYCDTRGSLTELWRTDDETMCSPPHCPVMSYWSITKPYVMRGPHQHEAQTDWFYTFKSKMVYQLYNPETSEMKVYFTNPNVVTRVKVAPPIIHSYRALEERDVLTANFPSALFMGEDKKSKIDEIRWEEKFHDTPVVFILGANGRLGKKLTNVFFDNMGFHKFEVIPCCEKIQSMAELENFFDKLNVLFKGRKLYFINSAAMTNVQDGNTSQDRWEWCNAKLPGYLASFCEANGWVFIGLSTDYVYQNDENPLSNYTKSKKLFEKIINNYTSSGMVKILRVANLFSTEPSDTHNALVKFRELIKKNGEISIDPSICIFPTDVQVLAEKIYELFNAGAFDNKSNNYFNVVPKKYNLEEFITKFYGNVNIKKNKSPINAWHEEFENPKSATVVTLTTNEDTIQNIARS